MAKKLLGPVFKPRDIDEITIAIGDLAEADRKIGEIEDQLNKRISELRETAEIKAATFRVPAEALSQGIYEWAQEHRNELLEGGKKSLELPTGTISWRFTPPAVSIKNTERVIEEVKKLRLAKKFLRINEEINKEAMLEDPIMASSIAGVEIGQREEFVIKPNNAKVERVKKLTKIKPKKK